MKNLYFIRGKYRNLGKFKGNGKLDLFLFFRKIFFIEDIDGKLRLNN